MAHASHTGFASGFVQEKKAFANLATLMPTVNLKLPRCGDFDGIMLYQYGRGRQKDKNSGDGRVHCRFMDPDNPYRLTGSAGPRDGRTPTAPTSTSTRWPRNIAARTRIRTEAGEVRVIYRWNPHTLRPRSACRGFPGLPREAMMAAARAPPAGQRQAGSHVEPPMEANTHRFREAYRSTPSVTMPRRRERPKTHRPPSVPLRKAALGRPQSMPGQLEIISRPLRSRCARSCAA